MRPVSKFVGSFSAKCTPCHLYAFELSFHPGQRHAASCLEIVVDYFGKRVNSRRLPVHPLLQDLNCLSCFVVHLFFYGLKPPQQLCASCLHDFALAHEILHSYGHFLVHLHLFFCFHALLCRLDDNLVRPDFYNYLFIVDMLPLCWNKNISARAKPAQALSVSVRFAHLSFASFQSIRIIREKRFIKI